ncbi:MAG: hypothetical protein ACLGPL_07580 [Acidobacteriota bacterium]
MAESKKDAQNWEERASNTFSAERKEDFFVLVLAGITVLLVWTGIVGPKFFNSLFF